MGRVFQWLPIYSRCRIEVNLWNCLGAVCSSICIVFMYFVRGHLFTDWGINVRFPFRNKLVFSKRVEKLLCYNNYHYFAVNPCCVIRRFCCVISTEHAERLRPFKKEPNIYRMWPLVKKKYCRLFYEESAITVRPTKLWSLLMIK